MIDISIIIITNDEYFFGLVRTQEEACTYMYDNVPRVLGKVTDAAQLQMTNYISDVVIFECKQIPGLDIHGKGV